MTTFHITESKSKVTREIEETKTEMEQTHETNPELECIIIKFKSEIVYKKTITKDESYMIVLDVINEIKSDSQDPNKIVNTLM